MSLWSNEENFIIAAHRDKHIDYVWEQWRKEDRKKFRKKFVKFCVWYLILVGWLLWVHMTIYTLPFNLIVFHIIGVVVLSWSIEKWIT